jgi:hypothetical protein
MENLRGFIVMEGDVIPAFLIYVILDIDLIFLNFRINAWMLHH